MNRFNRLLHDLGKLPPSRRQQAIAFAMGMADFTPAVIRLAARGAEILAGLDKEERSVHIDWLQIEHRIARLQEQDERQNSQ